MKLFSNEKKLLATQRTLEQKREEFRITNEQIVALEEELDRSRIDAMVSETPLAERIWHEHQRHMDAYLKDKHVLELQIDELERRCNDLRNLNFQS